MKEEKIFYLYFLNKMYRVLEDQEIIDSFIVPSVALQEPSSSQILTVGIQHTAVVNFLYGENQLIRYLLNMKLVLKIF